MGLWFRSIKGATERNAVNFLQDVALTLYSLYTHLYTYLYKIGGSTALLSLQSSHCPLYLAVNQMFHAVKDYVDRLSNTVLQTLYLYPSLCLTTYQ